MERNNIYSIAIRFLSCFLLLLTGVSFAQQGFDKIPLQGKIASYTTSRISDDSINPKAVVVEKVVFDKKGRMLTSFRHDDTYGPSDSNELNVYNGNTVTNYRCACKDISGFVNEFVIRDNAELKNMPRYATPYGPTKSVKITQLDKNGNAVLVSNYSESGYKVSEIKTSFDAAGNQVKVEKYDIDGIINETSVSSYDKNGMMTGQLFNRKDWPEEKSVWLYDDHKNLEEHIFYSNDVLRWDLVYKRKDTLGYTQTTKHDALKGTEYVEKRTWYDDHGFVTREMNFNPDGSLQSRQEYVYSDKGILISHSIYHDKDVLNARYEYKVDSRNNWIEMKRYQGVKLHRPGGQVEDKIEIYRYKREIEYSK